jgi:hypothetical protein
LDAAVLDAAPESLHLPSLDPFANAVRRIDANTWLTPDDRAFLTATLARLQGTYASFLAARTADYELELE